MTKTLDAREIFNHNHEEISESIGMPESYNNFYKQFVDTLYSKDWDAGRNMEDLFLTTVCDFQEDAYVFGFNQAMQLLTDSLK